jgi:Flp pilus assembly protein TadD
MKNSTFAIIIVSTLLTAITLVPLRATADEVARSHYQMVAVGNQSSGKLVIKGDYQLAVDRINGRYTGYPFANATNLCVALSMLGQLDQADPHCNEAVELASKPAAPGPKNRKTRDQIATQRALAYSNRGVMRILSGDESGAEEDFRMAIQNKTKLRAPMENLVRVDLESTGPVVARVSH